MQLKKSSGSKVNSKVNKAREEIADQIKPGRSNAQTVGMVLGTVLAIGALLYAITTFMGEDMEE